MSKVKVLDLLGTGGVGGIETLCLNAANYTIQDQTYLFLWKGGQISDEMMSRGYKVETWNTSIKKYIIDSLRVALKCRDENYDVVICHGCSPMQALCAVAIRLFSKRTQIIGYVHSSPEDWLEKNTLSARVIFRYAHKIICISNYVLNSVKKHFGYDDKLVRIYNGVDVSKFSSGREENEKKGNRLVYVGRLVEKKGVAVILKALNRVTTDYHFDILGDGDYRGKLEEQAKELGIEDKVTFHGASLDVGSVLQKSDIFIHVPVLEEGFGLTVVEAMAAGLLCICSKSGALPEIIEDGVTGYLVEKDNVDELAHVIQRSIKNYSSNENKKIRSNAINKSKEFAIESYSATVDNVIDKTKFSTGGGLALIYTGRLEKVKGVQGILKSLAEIKDVPYRFRIVGDGSYRQTLERLTNELGIEEKVDFLGMRRDIPELLWQSDIFVHLPEWQEGFGITVIEAMAAGLICVVNDHGALPEIIQDGVNGFVISNGGRTFEEVFYELADSIRKREPSIDCIRKQAKERAKDFSIEKYTKELDLLLADVDDE